MRYHDIKKDDFLNGDGIRAVLFVSGCTHHCPKCQNPVTWNKDGGIEFDAAAKEELFKYLENDYVSGITFSGGDPLAMYNREEVLTLINEVKEKFPDKTIWVYSGWTKSELTEQGFWDKLSSKIDVFVEGKFDAVRRSVDYEWAGSTNQKILRKENNFSINTSDPAYTKGQEIIKKASGIPFAEELKWSVDDVILKHQTGTEATIELITPIRNLLRNCLDKKDFDKLDNTLEEFLAVMLNEESKEKLLFYAEEKLLEYKGGPLDEYIKDLADETGYPVENIEFLAEKLNVKELEKEQELEA